MEGRRRGSCVTHFEEPGVFMEESVLIGEPLGERQHCTRTLLPALHLPNLSISYFFAFYSFLLHPLKNFITLCCATPASTSSVSVTASQFIHFHAAPASVLILSALTLPRPLLVFLIQFVSTPPCLSSFILLLSFHHLPFVLSGQVCSGSCS